MNLIGFHGTVSSGKDTAGKRLAQMVWRPTQRVSFAENLKRSAAALLDIEPAAWETYKNDPEVKVVLVDGYCKTPLYIVNVDETSAEGTTDIEKIEEPNVIREFTAREFLQRYGTEAHRDIFDKDFWVDQALSVVKCDTEDTLYYATDVRFQNECDGIRARGGVVIHVLTGDEPEIEWNEASMQWCYYATTDPVHPSEIPLTGCDFTIDNSIRNDYFENLDLGLSQVLRELDILFYSSVSA